MNESFLHYLWRYRMYQSADLKTTGGKDIRILRQGEYNADAGPDFFNARIFVEGTILAGNIEVHLRSSDWQRHGHQHDTTYQNIILHVVYEDDRPVQSAMQEEVLTLELRHRIPKALVNRYYDLMQLHPFVPCSAHFNRVDLFTKTTWQQRLLVERLQRKCRKLEKSLDENKNDWEETFYISLFTNFGFKVNALPFEMLARHIPMRLFDKIKTNLLQIEALLFGVSGFLENPGIEEKYYTDLRREFIYLKEKYGIGIIDVSLWKMLRLRPANFPQVRIAQLANLIYRSAHMFSRILEHAEAAELRHIFDCNASVFWDTHYTFEEHSTRKKKHLGEEAMNIILINTVVPFLFLYGKSHMRYDMQDRAIELLESLKPETNTIIKGWLTLGAPLRHAADTQALMELKKTYCEQHACLQCAVGLKILKNA